MANQTTKKTLENLPVVDSTRSYSVTVTKGNIVGSSKKDPGDCAIARACMGRGNIKEARIYLTRAFLRTNNKNWVRYKVPYSAQAEIIAFDRGGTFEPITFKLKPIPVYERYENKPVYQPGPRLTKKGAPKARKIKNVRKSPPLKKAA